MRPARLAVLASRHTNGHWFCKRPQWQCPPDVERPVDRLIAWARSGLEILHGMSVLQVGLIAALGLGLFYWVLGVGLGSIRRIALTALVLVAALVVARLTLPGPFCTVRWPSLIAALCSR
jgi:hypothetical protein